MSFEISLLCLWIGPGCLSSTFFSQFCMDGGLLVFQLSGIKDLAVLSRCFVSDFFVPFKREI